MKANNTSADADMLSLQQVTYRRLKKKWEKKEKY